MGVRTFATWSVVAAGALGGAAMWGRVHEGGLDRAWSSERARLVPRSGGQEAGYATSSTCRECHPSEYASWHHSFHRTMTQLAGRDTIVADWSGTLPGDFTLRFTGARPEVVRKNGVVDPVAMITGSHHMQIYWLPDRETRSLVAFEYAWLIEQQRFVPNTATLVQPEGSDARFTWNRICIRCHAVAGNPGWQESVEVVASEVAELGIACEACHGPGRAHADRHRDPLLRWRTDPSATPDDIVQPRDREGDGASEVCGQCHAITQMHDEQRWLREGIEHEACDALADWGRLVRHPARVDLPWLDDVLDDDPHFLADRFWTDGMVRVTGRELNALVESPCHASGDLSCLSCHAVHGDEPDDQLLPGYDGDAACTQCHEGFATIEHTKHDAAGEGARCQSCHMPRTTWGLLGAIRSHQVDTPDVAAGRATGRPVACNLCHLDRTLGWTAEQLASWSPGSEVASEDEVDEPSAAIVGALSGDAGVRALWAWHLGRGAGTHAGDGWQLAVLAEVLDDPYPAVREVAFQAIEHHWPEVATACAPPVATIADASTADCVRQHAASTPSDRDGPEVARSGDAIDSELFARWRLRRDDRRLVLAE